MVLIEGKYSIIKTQIKWRFYTTSQDLCVVLYNFCEKYFIRLKFNHISLEKTVTENNE